MTDHEILALYLARDERAAAETSLAYGAFLQRLAGRFLRDQRDVQECVNETLLKAWQSIPPNHPAHLQAYLAQLCRYTAFGMLDHQNAQKRSAELVALTAEMEQCLPDTLPDAGEARLAELLNGFLGSLPPDKRRMFLRRYWYGDSISEVAAFCGCSEGAVKTALYRIREKLKNDLERNGVL